MFSPKESISRRAALATLLSGLGAAGCRSEPEEASPAKSVRTDVPLRVTWVGGEADDFETVRRAWSAVSPLPLELTPVKISRDTAGGVVGRLLEVAERTDVVVYPLCGIASMFAEERFVSFSDEEMEEIAAANGALWGALRHGASRYAGVNVAVPLGGRQPALITTDGEPDVVSWADYDRWVEQSDGAAGEPLANGWAAAMFLWRAATSLDRGWLFEREGMQPLIASESYVAVLEQMRRTASRYQTSRRTPSELWQGFLAGRLKGGIGFPAGEQAAAGAVQFSDPPSDLRGQRVLLDPLSPVTSIAASCRQSSSAKRFIQWLAGGPGSDVVRRAVEGMTVTRSAAEDATEPLAAVGSYDSWLAGRLQSAIYVPTLQLLSAGDYYAALDDQVGRCLDGEAKPAEALREVERTWLELTDQIGVDRQQRAWRRAQGMLS